MIVAYIERETIKKIWYFNEIDCKIDNLMWGVLKSKHVKKKKFLFQNK